MAIANATNMTPSPGSIVVDPVAGKGDYTTITAAITAASSGQTVYVRPGTYTENPTLKAGVDIATVGDEGLTPCVTISGKCTFSTSGTVTISGILFQTNSDYCISNTSTGTINLSRCFINATNNTGILNSSTGTLTFRNCNLKSTDPYAIYSNTSTGILNFYYCQTSIGTATTTYNDSAGAVLFSGCSLQMNLSTSGAGSITMDNSTITQAGQGANGLIDINGSVASIIRNSFLRHGGLLAVLNIQSTRSCSVFNTCITTGAANTITGAGTLTYAGLTYTNSTAMSVTTQVGAQTRSGSIVLGAGTTLSSYVEGTFTPGLTLGGSSTGITFSTQTGKYTRIGNLVFCQISLTLTSIGGLTGAVVVTGLPVTVGTTTGQTGIVNYKGITLTTTYRNLFGSATSGTTNMSLLISGSGLAPATATVSNIGLNDSSLFTCTLMYFA